MDSKVHGGRITVLLDIGKTIALKGENLEIVNCPNVVDEQVSCSHQKDLTECFHLTDWSEHGDPNDLPSSINNILKYIYTSKENSTLVTYGCIADSRRQWSSSKDGISINVFDISDLYPSSVLAGATLHDPVNVDYLSERFLFLRDLPDPHKWGPEKSRLIEVLRMTPQNQELKFGITGLQIGDWCRIFQGPSPCFSRLCKILANQPSTSAEKNPLVHQILHCLQSNHTQIICILFTVGPILNKIYVQRNSLSNATPEESEISMLRECAVKFALRKASRLRLWIARCLMDVDFATRSFIWEAERFALQNGAYPRQRESNTALSWGPCSEEEIHDVSRCLAPMNRLRMCSTDFGPLVHRGELSAYQVFLSSNLLPEHNCIEVRLFERLLAHVRMASSPQALESASPEEKAQLLRRSIEDICPQHSLERMSLEEKLSVFQPLSYFCPGVSGGVEAAKKNWAADVLLCDGGYITVSGFSPDDGGRDLSLIELLRLEGVPGIEHVLADQGALSAWERHRCEFWASECAPGSAGRPPQRTLTVREFRRLVAPIRYLRALLCCPAGLVDLARALADGTTPLGPAHIVRLQEHSNGCNLWVTVAAPDAAAMRRYREVYIQGLLQEDRLRPPPAGAAGPQAGFCLLPTATADPSPHAIVHVEQASPVGPRPLACGRAPSPRSRRSRPRPAALCGRFP